MILHLLFDDKFGEYAIRQFSGEEMRSEFVLVTQSSAPDCHHKYEGVRVVLEDRAEFFDLLQRLGEYKAIVLHGLFFPWQERVLRAVPNHVKVAWVFWGGDIYGRKDIADNYLSAFSKRLKRIQSIKRFIKRRKAFDSFEMPFELLRRIDYCLTDVPEDFAFVKEYLDSEIKELWYNYYSVEETIGDLMDSRCNGRSILLGNSSSLECNHIEGLKAVRKMNLSTIEKVYVPLSYGESWLRKAVIGRGRSLLGQRLHPLTDYLPREKYNQIIQGCSVAVMPHYRPQAFGNIITALWLGTRVYMSNRSQLFAFFKRIGVIVFSLEDDFNNRNVSALQPLSDEETDINRRVISSVYSLDMMNQKNKIIIQTLDS